MSPSVWAVALTCFTIALLILPLLPGFVELYRRRDVAPLRVSADSGGDIRYFARGFRTYVQEQIANLGPLPEESEGIEQRFPDGTRFVLIRRTEPSTRTLQDWRSRPLVEILIVQTPLALPAELVVTAEIYATQPVDAGRGTTLRGLLGEADVKLGEECVVLRWIHGEADVHVGPRSTLYGRASAEGMLRLGDGCHFERIQAGRVEFGSSPQPPRPVAQPAVDHEFQPMQHTTLSPDCWLVPTDAVITTGSHVSADLIARGKILVEEGVHVRTSLKANAELRIVRNSRVDGAVISGRSIVVGESCRIRGPILAERDVYLATGTVVGSEENPTTISAEQIQIEPGVMVFGAVWTRGVGSVGPFSQTPGAAQLDTRV